MTEDKKPRYRDIHGTTRVGDFLRSPSATNRPNRFGVSTFSIDFIVDIDASLNDRIRISQTARNRTKLEKIFVLYYDVIINFTIMLLNYLKNTPDFNSQLRK